MLNKIFSGDQHLWLHYGFFYLLYKIYATLAFKCDLFYNYHISPVIIALYSQLLTTQPLVINLNACPGKIYFKGEKVTIHLNTYLCYREAATILSDRHWKLCPEYISHSKFLTAYDTSFFLSLFLFLHVEDKRRGFLDPALVFVDAVTCKSQFKRQLSW
jgi:hypothetical protein